MNRCPITYEPCGDQLYSERGLRLLSPSLKLLSPLKYTTDELLAEAFKRAPKISIQGVQPKLSAILNIKEGKFDLVDIHGRYILKPQHNFHPEVPQNEDLTMRLASTIGLDTPMHGMLYSSDLSLTYFIKRFDRKGQRDKVHVEDFAQLAGKDRDTKYNFSMEGLVNLIDQYCTFPIIEKAKLFKMTIFNFLTGNEDMHLKNYSIIMLDNKVQLSPSYDLLNTTIILESNSEEIALPLDGKKRNLKRLHLVDYLGRERCGLTDKTITKTLDDIKNQLPGWFPMIDISFLSDRMKEKYTMLLEKRIKVVFEQR